MRRLPTILISIAAFLLVVFVYYQSTYVSGTEIDVRSFRMRNFAFRRDPFTNLQLTGVKYSSYDSSSLWNSWTSHSTIDSAIQAQLTAPVRKNRWDLVGYDQSFIDADAQILIDLLSVQDAKYEFAWLVWTKDNPKKARVFWPAVQTLAQMNAYQLLPDLFEIAISDNSANELHLATSSYMATSLSELSSKIKDTEKERAAEMAAVALTYDNAQPLPDTSNNTENDSADADNKTDAKAEIESIE